MKCVLKMTDIATHFPPQTYSSSFFLNALGEEDEGERSKIRVKGNQDSHNLLDCFITKMFKPFSITSSFFTFLLLQYTFFPTVESECVDVNSPKTRVFKNLVSFQNNKIPFDTTDGKFEGNYVTFTDPDIDTLYKNSFITLDSEHIVKLFLNNHHIRTIQNGAFLSLTCVMVLNLEKNLIETISRGMFENLKALHELNLGENRLKEIPERVFISNARLRKLNITRNNLSVLHPESFYRLLLLEELDLSHNTLHRIQPDTFQYFDNLVNLQLGTNRLERLDMEKFNNLSKLNILNLSDNALESFDTVNKFSFGSTLTELYLNDNLLTQLNPLGIRSYIRMLKVIDIDDNPWSCSDLLPVLSIFNDTRVDYKGSTTNGPNIAGISCNKSLEEYKKKKWILHQDSTTMSSTTTTASTIKVTAITESAVELKIDRLQATLRTFYFITTPFFAITIVLLSLYFLNQCGCFQRLARYCQRPTQVLDDTDVENFSLLRQGF